MRLLILSLMLLSSLSHSQELQDVIYKKDGSVLRGVLIEQDFNNGRYKIQLNGGSVFSIERADIEKITKEAPLNGTASEGAININIENNPNVIQNNEQAVDLQALTPIDKKKVQDVLFIGSLMHVVAQPYSSFSSFLNNQNLEKEYKYRGVKLAYQRVHSEHFASQFSISKGTLDSIEIVDADSSKKYETIQVEDKVKYLGIAASIIASTNLQKGWQFFTGLGVIHDVYSPNNASNETLDSLILELGFGYSWRSLQISTQFQGYVSGDYPDEQDVTNISLQLGYNF